MPTHMICLIFVGLYNVAFDFDYNACFVDGVGCDGDSFGESASIVGVVANADFTGLARHDGLLGPFGRGATATGTDTAEDKGFVASVGEGEDTVAVTAFLDVP